MSSFGCVLETFGGIFFSLHYCLCQHQFVLYRVKKAKKQKQKKKKKEIKGKKNRKKKSKRSEKIGRT